LSRKVGKELPLHALRNSPEERGSHPFSGGSLMLFNLLSVFRIIRNRNRFVVENADAFEVKI
jgi:hypothetical protein